ncbi:hypothetical protein [Geminicoccus harenae]|uniref:hypothetical protein n=1 Tax=Geminicoccus harenae TaxID=2498453 RepID=UPI001C96D0AE|nr:hypothetical protein [Geminicoccus harenae]
MAAVECALKLAILPVSPPGAVAYAGPGFFAELERLHGRRILADCGERAGDVLACLRSGLRLLRHGGPAERHERLAAIARALGGELRQEIGLPLLAIDSADDLAARCRAWRRAAPGASQPV